MKTPFPVNETQTAISIAYENKRTIADGVLPRVQASHKFSYVELDLAQGFTVPDTLVGRRGKPSEVEFSGRQITSQTEAYGLDDPIPMVDIRASKGSRLDPINTSTEYLTRLLVLDRELRTSKLVFDSAIYNGTNKVKLAGAQMWSDANSKPIDDILKGLDAVVMRPNIMVIGQAAFSKLSTHPSIVSATNGKGVVTAEAIADLFGLEEVLVGESMVNNARKGQAAALARVWGPHCALLYREVPTDLRTATTFGFTALDGSRKAGAMEDPNIGAEGGMRVRVYESLKEVIAAPGLGYFIEDATS